MDFEAHAEFGGGEDFGGGAPAQDPLLGFAKGAEAEAEFEGAAGEVAHFLGLVPLAFADALGDGGGETDHDAVVAGAAHDPEGVGEEFLRGEIGGARKGRLGDGDFGNAREGESAQGGALEIEGDEIPEVFAVGQMVGRTRRAEGLASPGLRYAKAISCERRTAALRALKMARSVLPMPMFLKETARSSSVGEKEILSRRPPASFSKATSS